MPLPDKSPRAEILDEAKGLITGDRNAQYGPPTQDFQRTADILNALGYSGAGGRDILKHDIAIMVLAIKLSRIVWTPGKRDSWADMAGYVGCGWECIVEEEAELARKAAKSLTRERLRVRWHRLRRWGH